MIGSILGLDFDDTSSIRYPVHHLLQKNEYEACVPPYTGKMMTTD